MTKLLQVSLKYFNYYLIIIVCVHTHCHTHTFTSNHHHHHHQPSLSACSAFPTTCSGTIHGNIPSTKWCKISDSDQLAPKCLKTQGKASDNNNNDPDDNDDGTDNDNDNNLNDEGLVPMKGGQGGHKAHKQKNWENRYVYSTYSIPIANHSHRPTMGNKALHYLQNKSKYSQSQSLPTC